MRYPLLAPLAILLPIVACVAGSAQVSPQAPAAAPHGPTRVAIVNLNLAVVESREGIRATADFKAKFDARQEELDRLAENLTSEGADIEKQAREQTLSGDALAKRLEEWRRKEADMKFQYVLMDDELKKEQQKAVEPLLARMKRTVAVLAEKERYDLVLDATAVTFVDPSLDITGQAIAAFDYGQ